MFGSTRFLHRLAAFGLLVVVGGAAQSDSTKHVRGYGGVLPIPPAVDADDAGQAPDILVDHRPMGRAEKGRVLYANERVTTTAESDARTVATRARRNCSQVVQARVSAVPNS